MKEIELNGVTYVRKDNVDAELYSAIADIHGKQLIYKCGYPNCEFKASPDYAKRDTELLLVSRGKYDIIYFTCEAGHRNKLRI